MSEDDKNKVLDVRIPKEKQKELFKDPKYANVLLAKKYQVSVKMEGKVRYIYGDDPEILTNFAKAKGLKILKVTKL